MKAMGRARDGLVETLTGIAERFPEAPRAAEWSYWGTLRNKRLWAERTAFDIRLVVDRIGTNGTVCDVGGGFGLFAIGCAHLGLCSILVDDFLDIEERGMLAATEALLDEHGVEVRRQNILADPLGLASRSLDAVTAFHVLEHLPVSPKPLFRAMRDALRPGGVFVLAGPNNVNLRKRITVPLGKGSWSHIEDWYDSTRFRGHVREPNVADLRHVARDLSLRQAEIHGRNFLGLSHPDSVRQRLARLSDHVLRYRPTLCSDIYMVAQR